MAALAALLASTFAGAVRGPQLRVAPSTVRGGALVVIHGSGWARGAKCARVVRLRAFALGVSAYPAVSIKALMPTDGRFTQRWVTPHVSETYTWGVEGRQLCVKTPRVKIANVVIVPP